jgi:type I restriction enzyme S subunit
MVPLPPLREQRRIVEILQQADALREKRAHAEAMAARILPSLFQDLFGDPGTNPKRFPTQSLRELATKYSDGPFGSNLKSDHYVPSGVRVVRLQNIGLGEFIDDDKAFISQQHFAQLSKHECVPGDVLIGTLGDPNVRACIQPDFIPVALNKADCVQFRADPHKCTPEYVCWLLNSPSTLAMASTLIAGQTRPRISMGRLAELVVPRPPISLQRHFSALVNTFQPVLKKAQASTRNLHTLFQALLHRAFAGDLTATWRQAHMEELLAEMEQQARLLNLPSPERN